MLKHPKITSGRIKQFIDFELKEKLYRGNVPLQIEICKEPHKNAAQAKNSTNWEPVTQGFQFGPAYTTFWFRISGSVPKDFVGEEVGLVAEVGGERTIWKGNSPWRGVDEPHSVTTLFAPAKGGEKVNLYIESYTRNPQCRVHRRELPREQLVETVGPVYLAIVDRELSDLLYDCEFAYDTMTALPETDPTYAVLMRALNDVCNLYSYTHRDTFARCRRIVRDAYTASDSSLPHAITPVGHAHLDTAWLWPISITKQKMAHTTATQLGLIERYPEYIFCHSQASQYEWLEKEYPELFDRVKEATAKGQWEPVGSMWVEADCNLTGAESLVRQFLYGRAYFKEKLGFETHDMWLPDVFGYSAAIPQILSKFNINYFLTQKISWNQINKFPHNTFWWQGIDGTRVWTHFPPSDTYTGDSSPNQILGSVANHRDDARSDQSLYVYGWGDGGGGPTEKHIEYLRRAKIASGYPEIQFGKTAKEFFQDARARSKDLMTWVGELYAEFHRGTYTSQAANKRQNRLCEFALRDAELLACFRDDFPKKYPAKDLEAAWKLVLLNQFHDIIPGSSVKEVYVDSLAEYAKVRATTDRIISESLENIGSKFDTSAMEHPIALFQNATVPGIASVPWNESYTPASLAVGDEVIPVQEDYFLRTGPIPDFCRAPSGAGRGSRRRSYRCPTFHPLPAEGQQ